ncbi:MAG: hypothetical protein RIE77_00945 [Phycisphaerales bacterium]|jgi:hypothetical protein
MNKASMFGVLTGFALAGAAMADPVVLFQSALGDHPDGHARPPGYGLRLDNMFEGFGAGGTTTFSFEENGARVVMKILDTTGDGNADAINISGKVYGGQDSGSGYAFGEGMFRLDFTLAMGVNTESNGWTAESFASNSGVMTAMAGNGDLLEGTTFNFYQQSDAMAKDFAILTDQHRFPGFAGHVGRGWVTFNSDGSNSRGTQDFLFITIPLPGSAGLAMAGLGLVAVRRRRMS